MSDRAKIAYFLGIGGIGMSALARFYSSRGYRIYGYDLTPSPLTKALEQEGMHLHFKDSVEDIPKEVLENKDVEIIYTPAIPKDHPAFCYLMEEGYSMLKRSQALGDLTKRYKTIAVAGTHGKTTTTAIAAHILKNSALATVSFVGGLMAGYETNILMDPDPEWILVEADEFDRSFLQLSPLYLGVTSIDADHLDIYNSKDDLIQSFELLASKLNSTENILICDSIPDDIIQNAPRYGFSERSEIRIASKGYKDGFHEINVHGLTEKDQDLQVPMPGNHNALNAVLASALCLKAGCDIEQIKESLRSFQGVKRRFEYIINDRKCIFIDDYAHHPREIDALIDAVKQLYPNKKITGLFQPHLFSRTRDFADEFAESLSRLDQLFLLDIYPAREKPIPGINAEMLLEKVRLNEKSIVNKESAAVLISSTNPEILLTIGAGDIAHLVPAVKQALINSFSHL
jgi:UDP-N-acetylmuramate--alanine ligase